MSPTDQELLAIARAAADAGAAELSRYWGNLSQVRSKGAPVIWSRKRIWRPKRLCCNCCKRLSKHEA